MPLVTRCDCHRARPLSLAAQERLRDHQAATAKALAAYSAAITRLDAATTRRNQIVAAQDAVVEVARLLNADVAARALELSKADFRRLGVPRPSPASSSRMGNIGKPSEQTATYFQPTPGISAWSSKHPVSGDRFVGGHQDDAQPPAAHIHELRTALSASTNRRIQHTRRASLNCGRRSRGSTWSAIHVQAFCQCGWATNWQPWASDPAAAAAAIYMIDAALDDHAHQSSHQPFPHDATPDVDGYHQRCGWFHDFQDACPIPLDSPAGQLIRIGGVATLGDPILSLHRLAAIQQLRTWLDDQQLQAIIGARLAGCAWPDIAAAAGVTTQDATAKWGALIGRYEAAGLLTPDAPTGSGQQTQPRSTT